MLLSLALVLQLTVNGDGPIVCNDQEQLSELVEVILNPAMNTDPEYRSDVRDGMFEWILEGDCIILEEGTRIHLTNEPGWPGWLVQVRVDGETREWWGIFPTLIDTNDWEHC